VNNRRKYKPDVKKKKRARRVSNDIKFVFYGNIEISRKTLIQYFDGRISLCLYAS